MTPVVAKNPTNMTGEPGANPITIEWAGEDVWFNVSNQSGPTYKARMTRVAD